VNVIVVDRRADPEAAIARVWAPAQGQWLVAEANLTAAGCHGWTASAHQYEQRIDRVTRRHLKVIRADCAHPGAHAIVGEAHTDVFDVRHCGGDRMVDMNSARDALATRLKSLPHASVGYVRVRLPLPVLGGCGAWVLDDGRVAVITLG